MLDPALGLLIALGTALLFAGAALHKLRQPGEFVRVLAAYRIIPDAAARRLAPVIPVLEAALAAALLWPPSRRAALAGAAATLIAYGSGVGVNLARGRHDLDCGCSFGGQRRIARWMIWRNGCLAAVAGLGALPWAMRPWVGADVLTVAGGIAAAAALYAAADRLLGDVSPRSRRLEGTA